MKPWQSILAERAALAPFLAFQCIVTLIVIRSRGARGLLDRGGVWRVVFAGILLAGLLVSMVGLRWVNESIPDRTPKRLDPLLVIAFSITQLSLLAAMAWSASRRRTAAKSGVKPSTLNKL